MNSQNSEWFNVLQRAMLFLSPEKGQQPPTVLRLLTTRSDTKVQYIIICRRITCRALENKIPPRGKNIRNHRKLNHVVLKKRVKNVFICGSLNYLFSNPRLQKLCLTSFGFIIMHFSIRLRIQLWS